MRALTPLRPTTPERSLRLLRPAFRASRSQPLDGHAHRFARHRSVSIFQGFALQSQARRTIPPNQFVNLRATHSPPVAPHPVSRRRSANPARATVERRSYSRLHMVWLHAAGTSHPADKTSSRTHDCFASLAMTDRELGHLFLRVALVIRPRRRKMRQRLILAGHATKCARPPRLPRRNCSRSWKWRI